MPVHTIHALVGPTASGKESVGIAVAEAAGAEILVLDSMKLYRDMDVGTSKASPERRARVPHHLLDLASASEPFSAREWLTAAEAVLEGLSARSRRALFVGGTALYLKCLLYGLFEGPRADPRIRARLRSASGDDLHRRLREVDPVTAEKVHPHDLRRLIRALEVIEITGRPVSELRREWSGAPPRYEAAIVGIRRDRADLYGRIDARVDQMVAEGLVDEVRSLLDAPGGLGPVAGQALGYKEIAAWLTGEIPSLAEAIRLVKSRTRLFARRQLTWLKHFPVGWVDVAPEETPGEVASRVTPLLERLPW